MSAISDAIDALTKKVTDLETVEDSFIAFTTGLADQLKANAGNAAAINAIADKLTADSTKMSDAITANTTP